MVPLKDIVRVANGLSLVAKEAIGRQPLDALIKGALLSATDVAGLTKGDLRTLDTPRTHIDDDNTKTSHGDTGGGSGSSSSVVFFDNHNNCKDVESPDEASEALPAPDPDSHSQTEPAAPSTSTRPVAPLLDADRRKPRERRVPSTPFSRAIGFAGLGAGLAWGTLQESTKRIMFGTPDAANNQHALSPFLSERNAERLALALCRMRGAALKLGQMLSIQDESLVPAPAGKDILVQGDMGTRFRVAFKLLLTIGQLWDADEYSLVFSGLLASTISLNPLTPILQALEIVRQGADRMPRNQLNQVLDAELGTDWSSKLTSFDYDPIAAASIGQVHRAVTKDGVEVAMKIQYPGVADSIESDVENVKRLLTYTNLMPEKMYIDNAMKVAKEELSRECDYELEAKSQKRFRTLLSNAEGFYVPFVVDNLSSRRVLTTELVPGIPIDKVALLDQETRNYVGRKLLELTLMELFIFRFMQTDPNWSNFLYDETKKSINLIDFGAARDYPKKFVDDYLRMVVACANSDREAVIEMSRRLGFLTGMESEIMLEAHVQAGFVVGVPFAKSGGGGYDFGSTNITQSISNLGATMLRHRLTAPPEEAYSLHRKLSGAFLACIKLQAVVPCRDLLLQVDQNYHFDDQDTAQK